MKTIIALVAAGVFALSLSSCGGKVETKPNAEKRLTLVKIQDVQPQPFTDYFKVVAIVKPNAFAKLSSEEGGLITYLAKDKGSYVGRGEVIARLKKDVDYAAYQQSLAQYELAKYNYEKAEQLYKDNVGTEQQFQTAKYQLDIAEKSVDLVHSRLSKGVVVSPISGVVDQKFMNRGEMSTPGMPIINVVDISRVKITAGIPERFIGDIQKGSKVKITFEVLPGEVHYGTVNFVSPTISNLNRTFDIEIVLENRNRILKPEMSANVEITKANIENAIVLPQDLIIDHGEEKFVYVIEGNIARKRMVTIGGRNEKVVFIESGLRPGDKLVVEGFQTLVDGEKVEISY